MSQQVRTCLAGILLFAANATSFAQDVHILLRAKDGKTWFHLGETITLEATCVDSVTGHYLLPCSLVLKAEGVSPGSRMSADRIDQTTWLDAQTGELPPKLRGGCGTIANKLPSEVSDGPAWSEVTLKEPFPVYVGQYKISAVLAYDLEVSDRFSAPASHSTSDEVEIGLDDDLSWKDHLIHFHGCDYDVRLTLVPDSDAITALHKHLGECALDNGDDESLAMLLHEIVWLKMQVEQPELYSRMLDLEHSRPVPGEAETDQQKLVLEREQARLGARGEATQIRNWFHDQYRSLLLEAGRSLVAIYKSHPTLRNDGFHEDEQNEFGDWYDTAASMPGGANAYVSRSEAADLLRRAGASQNYISAFLKEHKSNLPLHLPEYVQRDVDFSSQ